MTDNNENTKKITSSKNKDFFIHFRVNFDTYKLLQLKSIESKMGNKPHNYARKIIEEYLILNDTKQIKKSLVTLNEDVRKNRNLIVQLLKWAEYFTQSFFASVPEIPKDEQGRVGDIAQKRMRKFFELMASIEMGKGNTIIEQIIADILQKEVSE